MRQTHTPVVDRDVCIKYVGLFSLPGSFLWAWRERGWPLSEALRWTAERAVDAWRDGELFSGYIAYDGIGGRGRGLTPAAAARRLAARRG